MVDAPADQTQAAAPNGEEQKRQAQLDAVQREAEWKAAAAQAQSRPAVSAAPPKPAEPKLSPWEAKLAEEKALADQQKEAEAYRREHGVEVAPKADGSGMGPVTAAPVALQPDAPEETDAERDARARENWRAGNAARMPFWTTSHKVRAAPILDVGDDHVVIAHNALNTDNVMESRKVEVGVDRATLDIHRDALVAEPAAEEGNPEAAPGHWLVRLENGLQWIVSDAVFRALYSKF